MSSSCAPVFSDCRRILICRGEYHLYSHLCHSIKERRVTADTDARQRRSFHHQNELSCLYLYCGPQSSLGMFFSRV